MVEVLWLTRSVLALFPRETEIKQLQGWKCDWKCDFNDLLCACPASQGD